MQTNKFKKVKIMNGPKQTMQWAPFWQNTQIAKNYGQLSQ